MLQQYYLPRFCHIGTPESPQEVNIGHRWFQNVSQDDFGVRIGPNLVPCRPHQKPDGPKKATMNLQCQKTTFFMSQCPHNHEGQGQVGTHVFNKCKYNTAQGTRKDLKNSPGSPFPHRFAMFWRSGSPFSLRFTVVGNLGRCFHNVFRDVLAIWIPLSTAFPTVLAFWVAVSIACCDVLAIWSCFPAH